MRFGTAQEKAFARDLVLELAKDLKPVLLASRRQVLSVNKITRQLEKTYQGVAAYQREHRPGFIRRAVLANTFKWELKNAGYPDDFVEIATEGLVVEMSKATSDASK